MTDNAATIIQAQADARVLADAKRALMQVGDDLDIATSALNHVRDIADEEWKQDVAVEVLALKRKFRALDETL